MGRLGILGMFAPSVRVAFAYAGAPGVVGSPGYAEMNCTLPRWTDVGLRAGPSGYAAYPFSTVTGPSSRVSE